MVANITDLIDRVTDSTTGRPVIAQLASPGKALAATSININDATNWTTTTAVHFSMFNTLTVGGVVIKDTTTQTDWKGVLAGTTISSLTLTGGTDRTYTAGAIVELTPTARYAKDIYEAVTAHTNQDGTLKTSAVQAALNIGTTPADYTTLATVPSTVVYNGNRSYTLTYAAVDYTDRMNPGTRQRFTRTVAAPTQCTNLNGSTQYYSKTTPAGMTATDDIAAGVWVKMTSYGVNSTIMSRYNGTSGWQFRINTSGQVEFFGNNAGAANYRGVQSYQSIPLNKWIHITAQIDMSTYTSTTTTQYVMLDGVDVPTLGIQGGTNPTALIQAGNLEVGSTNGGTNLFPGKIAQAFVSSAKITQANVRTLISQGLTAALITANSIVSAYSFNNDVTDLNTTNANNLTANGSAVATNADSPFGTQASGLISSTIEYGLVQSATFSTNTTVIVQVPEGCALPTSGGIATASYSSASKPYGFPAEKEKFRLVTVLKTSNSTTNNASYGSYMSNGYALTAPIGSWDIGHTGGSYFATSTEVTFALSATSLIGLTSAQALAICRLVVRLLASAASPMVIPAYIKQGLSFTTQSTFVMYSIGASTSAGIDGNAAQAEIFAENTLL